MSKFNKFLILFALVLFTGETVFAGGIVTNTNQSAAYTRMLVRDASTDMDAVYYNPAGLTFLPEGLFISLNNQSIFQTRKVTNDYAYLNSDEFNGTASAPLFPGVYAGYKTGDFVFSLGFNPVGGGGSAEWEKGLPSFQLPIADLVPGLGAKFGGPQNVGYSTDIFFEGTSVYYGIQGGVSYKINDMISVFAGVRYNIAQNTYAGHLQNTTISTPLTPDGMRADTFLIRYVASQYKADKERCAAAGIMDSAAYYGALEFSTNKQAELLGDQEADVEQTGSGITPIFGVNFNLLDNALNIGLKYEMNTAMKLKNKTTKDIKVGFDAVAMQNITQFPDGQEKNADIPALLSVGASYKVTKELAVALGFHYYFDQSANWDGLQDSLDGNSYEFGLGLEYTLNDDLLVSAGFLNAANGCGNAYQTDLNHTLGSNSIALGGKYMIMDQLAVNVGFIYTMYDDGEKESLHNIGGSGMMAPANYTFSKTSTLFAIGFDWYIFGCCEKK
ncbi:MAG: outer membrane protein transport protein [bacterium]